MMMCHMCTSLRGRPSWSVNTSFNLSRVSARGDGKCRGGLPWAEVGRGGAGTFLHGHGGGCCQEWILKPFEVEIDQVQSGFADGIKIRLELKWSRRMVMIRFGYEFGVALGTYCQAEDIECCSCEAMDYNLWVDLVEP